MASKKKIKARSARPSGKKAIAKKSPARTARKGAVKRTRPAPSKQVQAKAHVLVTPPSEPLFRATELEVRAVAVARKPVKKAEAVRPPRPPASLPIPRATFFF